MAFALRYAARSDVGLVREGNEDSAIATPQVLAVADGMGGHAAGEVASSLTVQTLAALQGAGSGDPLTTLARAVQDANERIREAVRADPSREGMGTTVTAVAPAGDDGLALVHVGDSRAYLLREGELRQVTHDHTYVQGLVDEGRITPAEALTHPARSLILRTLDGRHEPELDVELLPVLPGDRLLICSDGLSGIVSDDTMREALGAGDDLGEIAETLVELALRGGAPDNVTVVVAEVLADDGSSPDGPVLVGAAAEADEPPEPSSRRREGLLRRRSSAATRAAALGTGAGAAGAAPGAAPTATAAPEPSGDHDEEALRYAPRPPRRFTVLRRAMLALALVGALVLAGWWALGWTQRQYYVGADGDQVAIYRGLSQEVGAADLSEVAEVPDGLPVDALPEVYRAQVADTLAADDLDDARTIVARLREAACAAVLPDSPPVTRTPTPVPPSPRRTGAAPTPAGTPTPTPTPTPSPALPEGLDCTGTDAAARAAGSPAPTSTLTAPTPTAVSAP